MTSASGSQTRFPLIASLLLMPLFAAIGCQSASYTGAGPSARSFNEDPTGFQDTYIGVDFNFTIDDPEPHVPKAVGSRE